MSEKITIALPKGRLGKEAIKLLNRSGVNALINQNSRKLIFETEQLRILSVKPVDVIAYVQSGVADVGVVGKDTIMEANANIYELLDLGFGKCKFSVAGLQDKKLSLGSRLKIATKYPRVTYEYFKERSENIEIIKLNGSVELAPLVGLSDVIVDIVETGSTLKANNLEVYEDMYDLSARLIASKMRYRFNQERIVALQNALIKGLEAGE